MDSFEYSLSTVHGQAYLVQFRYSVWPTLSTVKTKFMDFEYSYIWSMDSV